MVRFLAVLAFVSLAACTTVRPPAAPPAAQHPPPAQQLSDAMTLIHDGKVNEGEAVLQALIAAQSFNDLPGEAQYQALATAGKAAISYANPKIGYGYLVRALAMPQAQYEDWLFQWKTSSLLGYKADTVSALTSMAQRWPERVVALDSDSIVATLHKAGQLPHGAALPLLRALYAAHWKIKWNIEPSGMWLDLALLLLEDGAVAEAIDVSQRVNYVYDRIGMRSDRRFDAVVAANPAEFNMDTAAKHFAQTLQSLSASNPRSLELKTYVIWQLQHQQRYASMLEASDALTAQVRSSADAQRLYEDPRQYPWLLNARATALERNGRWDEAVAQLSAASLLPEDNHPNVSQVINLGGLYCDLGRPKDALAAIGKVGSPSSYGVMELEGVRLDAALQLGDTMQMARSLQYLRDHRADNLSAYLKALIVSNQLDDAAPILIARLLDPEQRLNALQSLQTYARARSTPRVEEMRARKRTLIARKDVQVAIQKVGRIDRYDLEEENEE